MSRSVQLGPFAIDERIGAGGMGSVYRARHIETEEWVAVKVLSAETARRPKYRRDFGREVRALAQLHHPAIAAVVDYGTVDSETADRRPGEFEAGAPWFAMEYVDGEPTPKRTDAWNWDALEAVLLTTLDALAHAHARSIVHRDLKPDNVLLSATDDDGVPKVTLVDFGIARIFDPEGTPDDRGRRIVGTPQYMAPEQIRGAWRDQGPWTDLYALGCLAWRLVCGTPPFAGTSTEETLDAHLEDELPSFDPVYPVPSGLEEWLRRLLRREIGRRTRRAADAAWQLLQLDEPPAESAPPHRRDTSLSVDADDRLQPTLGSMAETISEEMGLPGTAPTREVDDAPADSSAKEDGATEDAPASIPPPVSDWRRGGDDRRAAPRPEAGLELFPLREVPLVDRADERDRLWKSLRSVRRDESAEIVTIEGRTGTGKTRLARWLGRRAHETGAAVVLEASHTPTGDPDAGLRRLVERRFRTTGLPRDEVFERLLQRLPMHDEQRRLADARALTELLRPTPDDGGSVSGPRYRFSGPDHRITLLRRLLDAMSETRPVVLVLDDLQWGGETIGLLEALLEPSRQAPALLAVATLRSEALEDHPVPAQRLESLRNSPQARRLDLDPLAAEDHRELVDRMLHLSPDLGDELADRTAGNPLFAIQLLHDWVDREVLVTGRHGFRLRSPEALEIPEDVHALWRGRLERILESYAAPDESWRALELAAALGREFRAAEWEAVLERAEIAVDPEVVDELVDRGLLERTDRGWRFRHGLLAESLARRARRAGRWRRHHRRCAETLEAPRRRSAVGPPRRVAEHWIAAGEAERALDPLLDAIEICNARGEVDEHVRLLDRRADLLDELDLPADDPRRLAQSLYAVQLEARREDVAAARDHLADVWEKLEDRHPELLRARCAAMRAQAESELGNLEEGAVWAEQALEASRRAGDELTQSRVLRTLAWNRYHGGNLERARDHAERAVELADQQSHRHAEFEALRTLGFILSARGEPRAEAVFERVRREAAEAGFVNAEAYAINGLGDHARFDGRLEDARSHYRRYIRKMEELHEPLEVATGHMNLAQTELGLARPGRASEHLRRAEHGFEAVAAAEKRRGLLHLLRLGVAAASGDAETFLELLEPLGSGWPDEWRAVRDHHWMLETVASLADGSGWENRARHLEELADELREQLAG